MMSGTAISHLLRHGLSRGLARYRRRRDRRRAGHLDPERVLGGVLSCRPSIDRETLVVLGSRQRAPDILTRKRAATKARVQSVANP